MTNLAQNLTTTAEKHGDRPAVKLDDVVLSYDQLLDGARRITALLKSKGVGPGDRVGLVLPNVPPFPVLFYGALAAGAVVVPMNPLLKAREVKYYLEDSGASIVFAWEAMAEEAGKAAETVGIECVPVEADGFLELLAQHEPDDEVVGPRRRRHRGAALHLRHDRPAQGRRAHPRQHVDQRRRSARETLVELSSRGRRDGLPAAVPLLRPDLRTQRRRHRGRVPDADPPLRREEGPRGRRPRRGDRVRGRADDVRRHAQRRGRRSPTTCPACAPASRAGRRCPSR